MNKPTHWWCGLVLMAAFCGGSVSFAATLAVNTAADNETADAVLTLREALKLAAGTLGRPVTDGEKAQVTGANWVEQGSGNWIPNPSAPAIGGAESDSIVMAAAMPTLLYAESPLPVLGRNDNLDGKRSSSDTISLRGDRAGDTDGLVIDGGGQATANVVKNMMISGFQRNGIRAVGEQGGQFIGLNLQLNGRSGLVLEPAPEFAPRNNTIGGYGVIDFTVMHNTEHGIVIQGLGDSDTDESPMNNEVKDVTTGIGNPLSGTSFPNGGHGVYLKNAFGNTIKWSTIVSNNGDGVLLEGSGCHNNAITGCQIGLYSMNRRKLPNQGSGVRIASGAHHNIVGGDNEFVRNWIAGNGVGVTLDDGYANQVLGNLIGTDLSTSSLGHTHEGVKVLGGSGHEITSNTITGNATGIALLGGSCAVKKNYIGTNKDSLSGVGNTGAGIYLGGVSNNFIGGYSEEGNVISGNAIGVEITGSFTINNGLFGNRIGTNVAGTAPLGNGIGVRIRGMAYGTMVGGYTGRGNLIAGNTSHGVQIEGGATSNHKVVANTIGKAGLGNGGHGVLISDAPANKIGTLSEGGNFIAGNALDGVHLTGGATAGNKVACNIIGLSPDFSAKAPNLQSGVALDAGAINNDIGGANRAEGNFIAGNKMHGIYIGGVTTQNNLIRNNTIGATPAGAPGFGNSGRGILLMDGLANKIGSAGAGNHIAFNAGAGVLVMNGRENTIRYNSIHDNGGLGIDLGGNSVTPNDGPGDADIGPNLLQNFPVVRAVRRGRISNPAPRTVLEVSGSVSGAPDAHCYVDVYASDAGDPSGYGEGKEWIGSSDLDLGKEGWANFLLIVDIANEGRILTATATDDKGNTSEFSTQLRSAARDWPRYQ